MKEKLQKVLKMIKAGEFKTLLKKLSDYICHRVYRIRAWFEDRRYGGRSVNNLIPSKYAETGAYATQSTDYRCLDKIFKSRPLKKGEVLADIGCGEGRVLTYLYSRGYREGLIGVELDPDVAEVAKRRVEKCNNTEIYCGNVLEKHEIFELANVFYLFNPFDDNVLSAFVQVIEETCKQPVIIYYCNDVHRHVLDKREKWTIIRRDVIYRRGIRPMMFSVFRYTPNS